MPLGWHISVYRQDDGGANPAVFGATVGARLAVRQTGLEGLQWLDSLVKAGKAIDLGGNGYPMEYTATAADILPQLQDEPPGAKHVWTFDEGDVLLPTWLGKTAKDVDAMNACESDEWLLIRAWDES